MIPSPRSTQDFSSEWLKSLWQFVCHRLVDDKRLNFRANAQIDKQATVRAGSFGSSRYPRRVGTYVVFLSPTPRRDSRVGL